MGFKILFQQINNYKLCNTIFTLKFTNYQIIILTSSLHLEDNGKDFDMGFYILPYIGITYGKSIQSLTVFPYMNGG